MLLPTRKIQRYGWKPDLPDHRDKKYRVVNPMVKFESVYLSDKYAIPAVRDQGMLGSCTGFGITALLGFLALNGKMDAPMVRKDHVPFSPMFLYYQERVLEGTVKFDDGAMIRDGVKAVSKMGCCTEKHWVYSDGPSKFHRKPKHTAYVNALNYTAIKYESIDDSDTPVLHKMIDCLNQGYPFVIGMTVYDSFESEDVKETGIVPLPKSDESILGGHCMAVFGYDRPLDSFVVQNSWGPNWGDKGYCYIPSALLTNPDIADDFWTIKEI